MNTTTQKAGVVTAEKSNWNKSGVIDGGSEIKVSGTVTRPNAAAAPVIIIMPINNAPFTLKHVKAAMINNPAIDNKAGILFLKLPNATVVASLLTIIPALKSPIKVINNPMPADIPIFNDFGIVLTIISRMLVKVKTININPSIQTAARATFQLTPIPITTLNVKNAFNPMPGASAIG